MNIVAPPGEVHEISPELLGFGIGVFQAVLTGEMTPAESEEEDLAMAGVHTVVQQVAGHGLSGEEEVSLVLRVVAFADLLERASQDPRTEVHLAPRTGGVGISEQFLAAAARASLVCSAEGRYRYDLDSVARHLLH